MKVALYARVSTDDKDQNPETQLLILRDYCKVYGHEILGEFVDRCSGKDPDRPAFKDMMLEARKDKGERAFDAIVVLRVDRFMRSALYGLTTTQELEKAECGLIFVRDNIDTTEDDRGEGVRMHTTTDPAGGPVGKGLEEGHQCRSPGGAPPYREGEERVGGGEDA